MIKVRHPARVVFVCVGNSCRSQMAEAFARHKHAAQIEPKSAGVYPAPIIQPETFTCMEEKGIPIEGQSPKSIREIDWVDVDLMVNMSGMPVLGWVPGFQGSNLVWLVEDPIGRSRKVYRKVRDRVEQLVDQLAAILQNQQQVKKR